MRLLLLTFCVMIALTGCTTESTQPLIAEEQPLAGDLLRCNSRALCDVCGHFVYCTYEPNHIPYPCSTTHLFCMIYGDDPPGDGGDYVARGICGIPGQCFTCRSRVTCSAEWPHQGMPHMMICTVCIMDPNEPGDDKGL